MSKNGNLSSAGKQAARALNGLKSLGTSKQNSVENTIRSIGTARQFEQIFTTAAEFSNSQGLRFSKINCEVANAYLAERSSDIQQKQLNTETRALQMHIRNVTGNKSLTLDRQTSEIVSIKESRAYAPEQISYLKEQQSPRMALSTEIAAAGGLRAHELHTIQKLGEPGSRMPSTHRQWSTKLYEGGGREQWVSYTVVGKGGLAREVRIPQELANRLEATRLSQPQSICDRGINYVRQYDLMGGQSYSNAWSTSSKLHFGFSNGAHGMRHSFAQLRMRELQNAGYSYSDSKSIVSQELGHFRSSITDEYLR